MKLFKATLTAKKWNAGFTLMEAIIALFIAGIVIAALVSGYLGLNRTAESNTYSVAAAALALQGYEQVRAAKWDALTYPPVDEVHETNFPPRGHLLDYARSGRDAVYATNYTTITLVSSNPAPLIKAVRVDCVYPFLNGRFYTSSVVSYRAPECGQQNIQESPDPGGAPPAATGTGNPRSGATNITRTYTRTSGRRR